MVRAIMIVEMAGRPPEHLTESIEKHIGILNQIKDIKVHSIKCSEPREIPAPEGKTIAPENKMYTVFAEADFETETFEKLTQIMFDFMPSSVEVIHPSKISMEASKATDLLNNISGRLHKYDEFAKAAGSKMQQMNAQLIKASQIIKAKDAQLITLTSKPEKKIATKKKSSTKKKPATRKKSNPKKK